MNSKILVIDDEKDILDLLSYNLKKSGFDVAVASDGYEAITAARVFQPDLILLDRMMPGKDGIQTLIDLRKLNELENTIIIFLTALGDEASEIEGLQSGADDYLSKPIKMDLLNARLKNALRKVLKTQNLDNGQAHSMVFGDLVINLESYNLSYKNETITLAKKEFELLALLASKPGRVYLRNEILSKVWGSEVIVGDRTIDVHIRKIRQKLDLDIIKTVKGVGYKFIFPE